jgi:hypothetical protein
MDLVAEAATLVEATACLWEKLVNVEELAVFIPE